ncbi:hypothetical protein BAUCODRAFT_23388 [Baudoinia panamericana UAMH 10762]|uniref:Uncharacterized protein n=1 Tax=Baudoinia panamericana (strain UAMH 10762) TaxID=717646 RepID=M2LRB9_BAUPA|nr:uncharacterized protein BAUCODRAFT_23388 [Baudoinia panamericana UAMH 10762]EMC96982.1 hypothetical protein BAUCODRAFT_23388 [Baudoinia panamericana UAMH 10762]
MSPKYPWEQKPYTGRQVVYILDACDDIDETDGLIQSVHYQKQKIVRRLFKRDSEIEIKDVQFQRRTKPEAVLEYFANELKELTSEDLMIIWFHGSGMENGEDYAWKFHGFPKKDVDAYELIGMLSDTKPDCMLLLDAYIPDRFWDKPTVRKATNNFEIIAKGETLARGEHHKGVADPGDSTNQLIYVLGRFVKEIQDRCSECKAPSNWRIEVDFKDWKENPFECNHCGCDKLRRAAFGGYKHIISLPELMIKNDTFKRSERQISARIRRVDLYGGEPNRRVVLDPCDVRATGKIRFWVKARIAQPVGPEKEQEDEGLGADLDGD